MTKKEISEALEFCIKTMIQFNHHLDAIEGACQATISKSGGCQSKTPKVTK